MGSPRLALCIFCALFAYLPVHANPLGGVVVPGSGAATFNLSPGTLTINQTTPKVIINWQDFSIGAGEITRFVQPSASAAALNRVTTANPSQIFGTLEANGAVYLINQNGILVGRSGQINVGSFLGSTLDLGPDQESANASFLSGAGLRLSGNSTAGVRNEGYISALDDVYLIAHTVQNAGSIRGQNVGLAAGGEIELRHAGAERLSVLAGNSRATPGETDGVVNSGNIQAVSAELKAAGGNIYALAINNGGVVRATSIVRENGRILLRADRGRVANSGTLDASSTGAGMRGGDIKVMGEQVAVTGSSRIDASGDAGGGNVLLAGTTKTTISAPIETSANVTVDSPVVELSAPITLRGGGVLAGRNGGSGVAAVAAAVINVMTGGSIQNGVDLANAGDQVNVAAGDFTENVSVNKRILLLGAQEALSALTRSKANTDESIIHGQVQLLAPGLTFRGFTVRDSTAAGIVVNHSGGSAMTPTTIERNYITANVFGMSLASDGASRTVVQENFFENNTVAGSASGNGIYTDFTVSNVGILANRFSGNPEGSVTFLGSVANPQSNVTISDNVIENIDPMGPVNNGPIGIGNISGVTISRNSISDAGDAIWIGGGVNGAVIENNLIQGNEGAGVKFARESSSGIAATSTGIQIRGNSFSANADGAILIDAREGSRYTDAANGHVIDASGNWWGAPGVPTVSIDVAPSATINIRIDAGDPVPAERVDFSPWLNSGVDTDTMLAGFQGDLRVLNISPLSPKAAAGGFIAEALATPFNLTERLQLFGGATYTEPAINIPNTVAVILKDNVTLDAPSIIFGSTVDTDGTAWTLDLLTPSATFGGAVGNAMGGELGRLNVSGSAAINGGIVKTRASGPVSGNQTYSGAVTLGADTELTGATINFEGTVNGTSAGNESLTINGNAVFGNGAGDFVGNVVSLEAVDVSGTTRFNAGNAAGLTPTVRTANAQRYQGTVTLGADTSLANSTVSFGSSVVGGGNDLVLLSTDDITLNGPAFMNLRNLRSTGGGMGRTFLSGGTLTANLGIYFNEELVLNADTTLTAPFVGLEEVTGNNRDLNVGASAFSDLAGVVSGVKNLNLTDATGQTRINAATITTSEGQTYEGAVTLEADTVLTGSGVTFNNTVNGTTPGNESLTIDGNAVFGNGAGDFVGNAVALQFVDVSGTTRFNAGSTMANATVRTTGAQDYDGAVTLGADTLLNGSTITFNDKVNGIASGAESLTIVGNAVFGNAAGDFVGDLFALELVDVSGSARFNAGSTMANATVRTTGAQDYDGAVTLGADTRLAGSTITFNGTVNGIANGTEALAIVGNAVFGNASGDFVGNSFALQSLDVSGTTALNGGAVTTAGAQDYTGAVTLGANTTLNNTTVTFGSTVNGGGNDLTLNSSANSVLNGSTFANIGAFRVGGGGNTTLNGGALSANSLIDIGDQLILGADTTLTAPAVTLAVVTGGGRDLTVNASGATTLNGAISGVDDLITDLGGNTTINQTVSAGSVTLNDQAALNGGVVTTTREQTYNAAVTLGADTTLNNTTVTFGSTVNGGGRNLTLNSSDNTTLNGTAFANIGAFRVGGGGNTTLNGGALNANALIDIADELILGADTTVTAPAVTLAVVTGNGRDLIVNASGATTLSGAVAGVDELVTDALGSTVIRQTVNAGSVRLNDAAELRGGTVTTSGNQNYAGATLGVATTLNGVDVTLGSVAGADQNLTVNASGVTTFNGTVNGVNALVTDGPGSTVINQAVSAGSVTLNDPATLNGLTITTLGDQTYNAAVTLGAHTTMAAANATVAGVTGGGNDLALNVSGSTTLNGAVGGVRNLSTDAAGTTGINGGTVTTSGTQTYGDAVSLGAETTLNAGSDVTLDSTLNGGGRSLFVNSPGVTTFGGNVSGVNALRTDVPGSTTIGGTFNAGSLELNDVASLNGGFITTSGNQNYNNTVFLGADSTLSGQSVSFSGINGGGQSLAVNSSGNTVFGGAVGGVNNLTTDAAGNTFIGSTVNAGSVTLNDPATLNGGLVTTGGDQDYNNTVTLGTATTLVGNRLGFGSSISGGSQTLTLDALQNIDVEGTVTLGTLNVLGAGDVNFDAAIALGTLDIRNAVNVTHSSTLTANDLFFTVFGSVSFLNSGNQIVNAELNCPLWSADGGFLVSDSGSGKAFVGTLAGTCVEVDNNEALQRAASQLVPQVQFTEIQADTVNIEGKALVKPGILTRSSAVFRPRGVLTRSAEVDAAK